jgi:AcrR family transcriptional regulator
VAHDDGGTVRKDVTRNRQLLLDAGKELFASWGLDATLDDIAHHAGLGTGTAYRHFGSRQEIITAIFSEAEASLMGDVERCLAVDDPWDGLVMFMETVAARQAADRGLHQMFTGDHGASLHLDWGRLFAGVSALVERAKAASLVRADIEPSDLIFLFTMMGPAYDISARVSVDVWRRYIDFFLRAIQPTSPPAAVAAPLALTTTEMSEIITNH